MSALPSRTRPERLKVLHEGRHLRLVRQDKWEFVERVGVSGVVVIVAVTDDGKLLLTEQFRPPINCRLIELPAGLAGDTPDAEAEVLVEAARRELLEETGFAAKELTLVAQGPISAGLTSEVVTLFRARGLRRVGPGGGEGGEVIKVHEVPVRQVHEWLRQQALGGTMVDLKVWAGLHFVLS